MQDTTKKLAKILPKDYLKAFEDGLEKAARDCETRVD